MNNKSELIIHENPIKTDLSFSQFGDPADVFFLNPSVDGELITSIENYLLIPKTNSLARENGEWRPFRVSLI